RLDDFYIAGKVDFDRAWRRYAAEHPWWRRARYLCRWLAAVAIWACLLSYVRDRPLPRIYLEQFSRVLPIRPDPTSPIFYGIKCALHYHGFQYARVLSARDRPIVNTY